MEVLGIELRTSCTRSTLPLSYTLLREFTLVKEIIPTINLRSIAPILGITEEIREQVIIFIFLLTRCFLGHPSEKNSNSFILVKGSKYRDSEGPVSGQPCPASGRTRVHKDAARHCPFHFPLENNLSATSWFLPRGLSRP